MCYARHPILRGYFKSKVLTKLLSFMIVKIAYTSLEIDRFSFYQIFITSKVLSAVVGDILFNHILWGDIVEARGQYYQLIVYRYFPINLLDSIVL
jgi:hypothetical protein